MKFIKAHWKQLLTLIASLAVGLALHFGYLSADSATAIGAALALVGIHLAPITYGKPPVPPPSLGLHVLALVALGGLLIGGASVTSCTTAEQQQVAKIAPEAAACVFAVVEDVTVAPDIAKTIATCGVTAQDVYALVAELLAKQSDAGPDGSVGASPDRAHLEAWLAAAKAAQ